MRATQQDAGPIQSLRSLNNTGRRVSGVITNGNWGACQWTISEGGDLIIYEGKAETIAAEAMSP